MKDYTYNTFTVDGHKFSMTDYKDEMKVYIKSIHPYDDADYHWALNRNGGDFYVVYIGSPGKKVDTVFGSKEKVARKLLELDKNVEPRMSYESRKNNKNESTKDRFTYDEIETIKDVSEIGDWAELIEIIKDKFGKDEEKQDWDEEDWDDFLRNDFGWVTESMEHSLIKRAEKLLNEEVLPHNINKVKQLIDEINKIGYFKIDGEDISVNKGFGTVGELIDLQALAEQFKELGFKVRTTHFHITVYGLKDFMEKQDNKNESVTYHFSVEDIGISGNNWIFPEEAYEEAKSRLSKLGYKVSDLTDDLEFTVIGDSTGVAYDGVIYSKEDVNESVPKENLAEIYKVLDYYMTKLGFNLIEDKKSYFINKKYIKSGDTNYIHFVDFTPQMDNDQLKYEVRDEKGHQKLCNVYNILDAVDMDTSLKLIEFDMEGFE